MSQRIKSQYLQAFGKPWKILYREDILEHLPEARGLPDLYMIYKSPEMQEQFFVIAKIGQELVRQPDIRWLLGYLLLENEKKASLIQKKEHSIELRKDTLVVD